jgi:hypothetical protein
MVDEIGKWRYIWRTEKKQTFLATAKKEDRDERGGGFVRESMANVLGLIILERRNLLSTSIPKDHAWMNTDL